MKKMFIALIFSSGLLCLAACVSDSAADKSPAARELGEGIIEDGGLLWDTNANGYIIEEEVLSGAEPLKLWLDNEGFANAIIEGFTKIYPEVRIEVQSIIPQDSINKMVLEGEAGTGADVFFLPHDLVGRASGNSILGMMGRYEDDIKERFMESAIDTVTIDGNMYGIPYNIESLALYYNKTLLEELHEKENVPSADPAQDFNEIITLAEKYNSTRTNRWTIRWQVEDAYYNYMFLSAYNYELFGPDGTEPDLIGFNNPEVLEGMNYFKDLRRIWDINTGDSNWNVTTMEFAKGRTPYLISGPWSMEPIHKGAVENDFEFGITKIPMMDGRQPYTFLGVNIICVSPYSKYPAAARALAMYIASEDMLTYTYGKMGKIPALNEKYAANIAGLNDDIYMRGFMEQAEFSNAMPSIQEMTFYWSTARSMFQAVWDGVLLPQEAVDKAYDEYDTLRSTAN